MKLWGAYIFSFIAFACSIWALFENFIMSNAFAALQQSPIIIDKEVFANFENSIVSKLGTAAAIISIGATVIGCIVAILSVFSSIKLDKLGEVLKKKQEELDQKYSWVNIIPYISLGNYNKLSGNPIYAKNDYEAAYFLDRKNIFVNYFLGVYYADLYSTIVQEYKKEEKYTEEIKEKLREDFLDHAKNYIQWAIDDGFNKDDKSVEEQLKQNVLKSELYTTLGSIYGLYGKSYLKSNAGKAKDYFNKSIDYLKKALEFSGEQQKVINFAINNSETYVGLGISYAYLFKYHENVLEDVYYNFENAIKEDNKNLQRKYKGNNLPWRDLKEDGLLNGNTVLNDKIQELEQKYFKDETGEI